MDWKNVLLNLPGQIPAFLMDLQPCNIMRENPSHQRFEAHLEALQPAFPKDRRHQQGQEKEGQQEEEEVQGSAPIFHPQNLEFADPFGS